MARSTSFVESVQNHARVAATFAYAPVKYTTAAGASEDSDVALAMLPAIYGTMPLDEGNAVVGIGLTTPYGQSMEWGRGGLLDGATPDFAQMMTANIAPSFGVKLSDSVSVGAGLNVMWANLEFKQSLLPPPGVPAPSSRIEFEGDGYSVGGTVGLVWQITDNQRLGVSYRTAADVTVKGDFSIANAPPTLPAVPRSDFETEIKFPAVAAIGYGIQVSDTLRLEADVEWIEHSQNDVMSLDIGVNNPLLAAVLGSADLPQDWDDTWTFGAGADWNCSEEWVLRTGFTWLPTPVPDSTFLPVLTEGDKVVLGVGAGYQSGAHKIDFAYSYSITEDREVTPAENPNPGIAGTYEMEPHLASVTYGYQF
ncbi:MAG: outer membrane protein transport protein [Kiritimatiellia bacterium]|nr:outer membrane protein transport protein [Kiritimatiellia bacterium]MDP6630462.1 outer membrane protein transport protein [Kiritimatiellia bacterium]MDP6809919.1 outer membrane protein transport protein [Kiritimatiellia bacterium]MDP7024311.1 outer membrane protein transport protein [Kiritimatiellia bacterium]